MKWARPMPKPRSGASGKPGPSRQGTLSCTPLHRWHSRGSPRPRPKPAGMRWGGVGWGAGGCSGLASGSSTQRHRQLGALLQSPTRVPGPHHRSPADRGLPWAMCTLTHSATLASTRPLSPVSPLSTSHACQPQALIPSPCLLHSGPPKVGGLWGREYPPKQSLSPGGNRLGPNSGPPNPGSLSP